MNVSTINAAVLAYLGDGVYEILVRKYLFKKNISNVNDLQNKAVLYVSAEAQSKILDDLLNRHILYEDELYTIKRARNYKTKSKPKNVSYVVYKKATALEALFGMLYLQNKSERIKEIFNYIVE